MHYSLRQRGRASVDFLVDLGIRATVLDKHADAFAERAGLTHPGLPGDADSLHAECLPVMRQSRDFRMFGLVRDWQLERHGVIAMGAFDEVRGDLVPELDALQTGPASLELDETLEPPGYWAGYEFHRSAGGWDGHDYMGFVHGEIIHRRMVGDTLAGIIMQQRRDTAGTPCVEHPGRILELGCASGQYTIGLAEAYPDAEIWGVDLSARQLEQCQRLANAAGLAWRLLQANAERTGLPAGHFDLVTSYAMFHELPVAAIRNVLAEALRLLRPGGVLLVGDVKAYSAQDPYRRWKADWLNQVRGGDPYWREFCTTDLAALATEAGFEHAEWAGVGEQRYPFVLTATKPA